MIRLNRHPFPIQAHFEKSLVLSYAMPSAALANLIPECLELDTFEERYAFVAVAMVRTKMLRPKGFPKFLGRDFTLIGYRIFVRYRGADGRRLRGLYILRSETDRRSMRLLGAIFTRYRYQCLSIDWQARSDGGDSIRSTDGLHIEAVASQSEGSLPTGSPFPDWKSARRFAGPMPYTFSYDAKTGEVVIVEGVRSAWKPVPVLVERWQVPFFDQENLANPTLANAFLVKNVPYHWRKGRTERWAG